MLNKAAGTSFARQQIKVAAALSLGFASLSEFKGHTVTLDGDARAALRGELKEAATAIAERDGRAAADDAGEAAAARRSGESLWQGARVAVIPLVSAVRRFTLRQAEASPVDAEGESRLTAAIPIENPYCSRELTRVREDVADGTPSAGMAVPIPVATLMVALAGGESSVILMTPPLFYPHSNT